jgi:ribonuclease HI
MLPNIRKAKISVPKSNPKIFPACEHNLYFDGCSKGNPGPSGIGAVLYKNCEEIWANCQYIGKKRTNNEAEYCALIMGLEQSHKHKVKILSVYGDSLLVINQLNGIYKVNNSKLIPLFEKVLKLKSNFEYIEFTHIYRDKNVRADELANLALKAINLDDDSDFISLNDDWDQEYTIEKMLRK